MSNDQPDLEPQLHDLFRRTHEALPPQPFVGVTLQRVAARRRRLGLARRVLGGATLAAIVASSPWLIRGSVWLSDSLDVAFRHAAEFASTPLGMVTGLALAAVAVLVNRRRLF